MGEGLKLILSNSLKSLEQGAFQEFCLIFLPIYDKKFKGLERHGGTAGGKTRKGTPDLIKTTVQGKQIAVQCSTEEDYWVAPSDPEKTENWKPIKDISRCLEDLKHLKEIVLCSNQEIPTSFANVKSEIRRWAKVKTNVKITIFSISNFEIEILKNRIKYSSLIEQHLPELNAYIESYLSHTTLKTYRQRNAPLSTIEEIVRRPHHRFKKMRIFTLKFWK
jgi:hypothetical protein